MAGAPGQPGPAGRSVSESGPPVFNPVHMHLAHRLKDFKKVLMWVKKEERGYL